jgi:hypothetical protein
MGVSAAAMVDLTDIAAENLRIRHFDGARIAEEPRRGIMGVAPCLRDQVRFSIVRRRPLPLLKHRPSSCDSYGKRRGHLKPSGDIAAQLEERWC